MRLLSPRQEAHWHMQGWTDDCQGREPSARLLLLHEQGIQALCCCCFQLCMQSRAVAVQHQVSTGIYLLFDENIRSIFHLMRDSFPHAVFGVEWLDSR